MEKIEEKARYWFENCNITFKKPTDMFKDGYTTRNDEVVKMLQEELTETENKITGENNTFYEVGSMQSIISDNVKTVMAYHATRIENLLTKLKEDKK